MVDSDAVALDMCLCVGVRVSMLTSGFLTLCNGLTPSIYTSLLTYIYMYNLSEGAINDIIFSWSSLTIGAVGKRVSRNV